ncbi:LuxR family transcriptional regulator [Trujillonella endophytica]|uniref:LuxR family transcriptional regulator, maltose regulon positive regulatory protein n=1 Tax=Trujillonella endophytica TaxID=673521 RepID=A0A1H8QNR7_9ACTN|nr:LuxR family transcriptional regulator [Trujillella endophytica]SEO55638.1 LuxR family transcriptional regulator, maltose regulon positive regulatory protein [Trujillella endophytica]
MAHRWRSKTAVPGLPADHVSRPALLSALDRGEDRALTLVSSPPGYGKSLLLADWAHRREAPTAWVALDEADDDPRRLWTSVLAALSACPAVPATSPLTELVVPRTGVGIDLLMEVFDALAALPVPVRLVLDDAHHLRSPDAVRGLQLLLRHRLRTVRLVLSSRFDPPLPIARLRMEQRLCELRTAQLAFSVEETAALTARCGLRLTHEQAALLHARTDGWVAGIRLATTPLRNHPDADRFLADFSGDLRPVADYLAGEVLASLSPVQRELLRRTSIADPVPAALAVELSGRADAADLLGALERGSGLVVSTGERRSVFRIQELMRSYLVADLHRHGPGRAAALHGQAAAWWAAQGRPVTALHHAERAADDGLVAALLHRWAPELVARGEHRELSGALAALEGSGGSTDAWLPVVAAQVHVAHGDLRAARAELRRAGDLDTGSGDTALAHFRIATEWLTGAAPPGPLPTPSPAVPALAALVAAGRGAARMFSVRGPAQLTSVLADLETALDLARDQHLGFLEVQTLCLIGTAAWVGCDHGRAAAAAAAAVAAAGTHGWQDSWWAAAAHAVLAHSCLVRATPAHALRAADDGLRIDAAHCDPGLRFSLRSARGGALFDLGERALGLFELQEAHAEVVGTHVPRHLAAAAALLEHRAALMQGSAAAAATSAGRLADEPSAAAERALVRAWSHAAAGAADRARGAVAPILDGTLRPLLPTTTVDAGLVEVWAALRSGDRPGARRRLQAVLVQAEELDVLRPFALAGQGVRALLVDQLGGTRDPASFAFRCLAARRRVSRAPSPRLSSRERDVLVQLVSLSNLGEIAEDMSVSVNTIKSHVRAIYGKLGVNTRRTAVLTALDQGLLS